MVSMNNTLQIRPITRVPFDELGNIKTLHVEQLVISLNKNHDIGAWCYKHRSKKSRRGKCKPVVLTTLDHTRPARLKAVIECIYEKTRHLSESSQEEHLYCLTRFLNWCDEDGFSNVLLDQISTRNAYKAYSDNLRDLCTRGNISVRTAETYQSTMLTIFQEMYDNPLFGDGIRCIKSKYHELNTTPAQNESDQAKVLAWCQSIFDGFSDFVLTDQPFPFQLPIPQYNHWKTKHLWLFPCTTMTMTPDKLAIRSTLKRGFWAYDYSNGKLNSRDSINTFYRSSSATNKSIRYAQILLTQANTDLRHSQRKRLAAAASLAFIHLFYAYSGQNSTPVQSMLWPDDYKIDTERQGFRIIKNRGHKGKILFEIQNTFLPSFKKYLKLREWLLKDTIRTELLFFTIGNDFDKPPHSWSSPTESFKDRLRSLGIELPSFGARQFRANKNDYANSHTDLATAAKAANHSIETHKKSYMTGTQSRHTSEMSGFFSAIVKSATETKGSGNRVGLGNCEKPGNPTQLPTHTTISPKCGQPEGCLFCKYFFIHTDEDDIRKLVSGRYVIHKTRHLSDSQEQFDSLFNPVFKRIKELLNEISGRSIKLKKLVDRIIREVDEEEDLSDFWASELRYLIDLELVNE